MVRETNRAATARETLSDRSAVGKDVAGDENLYNHLL